MLDAFLLGVLAKARLRKFKRGTRGVSPLISMIFLIGLAIVVAVLVIGMVMGWFKGASSIQAIDASGTKVYVEQSTGKGKILLSIKNAGTSTLRLGNITIDGVVSARIYFTTGPPSKTTIAWSGKTLDASPPFWGSSSSVAIGTGNTLIVPPSATVTLEFTFDGSASQKLTDIVAVGNSYHAVIYPAAGAGSPYDFTFLTESK